MSNFATKFRKFWAMANPLVQSSDFVSNSFGDLATRIASIDRRNLRKNTARPNEFTDFEKFKVSHPKFENDFSHDFGRTSRYRYYSSANRSTSHIKIGDRGDTVFFGHVGGRLRAYFGHDDAC